MWNFRNCFDLGFILKVDIPGTSKIELEKKIVLKNFSKSVSKVERFFQENGCYYREPRKTCRILLQNSKQILLWATKGRKFNGIRFPTKFGSMNVQILSAKSCKISSYFQKKQISLHKKVRISPLFTFSRRSKSSLRVPQQSTVHGIVHNIATFVPSENWVGQFYGAHILEHPQ